jgi:cell division protein FtsZ
VDFADVKTIMGNAGTALMGIGTGRGKTRACDAAVAAISSPLLDFSVRRAKGIVFNIVGSPDLTLSEINAAAVC